ncbi:hypothetical protein AN189_09585 [Loktanella sp. 3ANDIMAR09]|uniref:methyltransferase family protein n=1 Tax=Loktanella sp. 3ANDIMAR09 TaxID=1225657 RepID=UPI0006F736AC|nr:methyltransferase [Loktanella sp. 3ANDIMAR09]KQI68553.1 hypothetical protein AN189_09585 [Loktanella sp. 3ANDIMAR09]
MKRIDLPPVWLALCAMGVWLSRGIWTAGTAVTVGIGTALIVLGIVMMAIAVVTMARRHTTVMPHREPSALVSHGIFAWSRNPIYLADAIVLVGLCLRWQAPLGLLLVPVFIWWITRHFIAAEEARLRAAFGTAFVHYAQRTRRWL